MDFDLTGKLLISTPAMGDTRFHRSVLYLCAHTSEGAFGLAVNRPIPGLTFTEVMDQLNIPVTGPLPQRPVLAGGPVEAVRGFVLFRGAEAPDAPDCSALADGLSLSTSPAILAAIARGDAPAAWFLALGYAGWGPGQLEDEIAQNAWLTCETDDALLFSPETGSALWNKALQSMGVDPLSLSAMSGRA
ncbi:MAG: YqgE/AlgH family protein [Pararhodobacter sp.]|nr:YqgE/AlgH family protein [Pararhodobacter sp.]